MLIQMGGDSFNSKDQAEDRYYSELRVPGSSNRSKQLDIYRIYMAEATKFPLLTQEQERRLAKKIEFANHGLVSLLCDYQGLNEEGEDITGFHFLRHQYHKLMLRKHHVVHELFNEFAELDKEIYLRGGLFNREAKYCEQDGRSLYDDLFELLIYRMPREAVRNAARTLSSHISDEMKWMEGTLFENPDRITRLSNLKNEINGLLRSEKKLTHKFTQSNLRLAVKIAGMQYNTYRIYLHTLDFNDLIQYANEGLMKGIERFDYRRGPRFATYGSYWIKQSISRGIQDHARTVRFPANVIQDLYKYHSSSRNLFPKLQRKATLEEIAEDSGLSEERVGKLARMHKYHASLDKPIGEDQQNTMLDLMVDEGAVSPEEHAAGRSLSDTMRRALARLSPREERIVRMRFGIGFDRDYTLEETGREFGFTRERARQIEAKALKKLKKYGIKL